LRDFRFVSVLRRRLFVFRQRFEPRVLDIRHRRRRLLVEGLGDLFELAIGKYETRMKITRISRSLCLAKSAPFGILDC
jgi:hypothetical protein